MRKISKYFKGVAEEAHRVRWPSSKELWKAVAIVVVITVVCCLVLLLCDYLTYQMVHAFQQQIPSTNDSSAAGSENIVQAAYRLSQIVGKGF